MKKLGHIYRIVVGIIVIIIVSAIFYTTSTHFEVIVFAGLIFIYVNMCGFFYIWVHKQIDFAEVLENEFKKLQFLINKEPSRDMLLQEAQTIDQIEQILRTPLTDKEKQENEEKKEREKNKKTILINIFINQIFLVIISIIALYNLLLVLF